MSTELVFVLIILIILVIVSEYGIEGVVKAIIAGLFIILAVRAFNPDVLEGFMTQLKASDISEGFMTEVSSLHANSDTVIPEHTMEKPHDPTDDRKMALDSLFGPPAILEKDQVEEISPSAKKYFALVEGEYGRDHQYMDRDTDLPFAVEAARRGRMMKEQLANQIKSTPDTWRDLYEPELRAAESGTRLRI